MFHNAQNVRPFKKLFFRREISRRKKETKIAAKFCRAKFAAREPGQAISKVARFILAQFYQNYTKLPRLYQTAINTTK
jgi:hypothetical protein